MKWTKTKWTGIGIAAVITLAGLSWSHQSTARKRFMPNSPASTSLRTRGRALVLGGGGPVGRAWESGLAAGLLAHSIDLAGADLIIGTSAGAIVGAEIALGLDLDSIGPAVDSPGKAASPAGTRMTSRLSL
ncbi:hypothetical protein [Paenibacillus humicola]|uniref:hypothetical protein n=1 Tax=Paenibacillus humicola TaxID=3110540 RepID=UPI00237B6BE4|nr:hypothetical protein [Paenibacillus humicola]